MGKKKNDDFNVHDRSLNFFSNNIFVLLLTVLLCDIPTGFFTTN